MHCFSLCKPQLYSIKVEHILLFISTQSLTYNKKGRPKQVYLSKFLNIALRARGGSIIFCDDHKYSISFKTQYVLYTFKTSLYEILIELIKMLNHESKIPYAEKGRLLQTVSGDCSLVQLWKAISVFLKNIIHNYYMVPKMPVLFMDLQKMKSVY